MTVHRGGSNDGRPREGFLDGFFALGLGAVKLALRVVVRVDVRDVYNAGDASQGRDARDPSGALDGDVGVGEVLGFVIPPDQVVDDVGMPDALLDLGIIAQVELERDDLSEVPHGP